MAEALQFTFDPALVATEEFHEVRSILGDIDAGDPLLDDRLVQSYITLHGKTEGAARLAEVLSAQFARLATQRTGDIATSYSDLTKHYRDVANTIRQEQSFGGIKPTAGGLSKKEREERVANKDLRQPSFERGMHDNPRVAHSEDLTGHRHGD